MQLSVTADALSGGQRGVAQHLAPQLQLTFLGSLSKPAITYHAVMQSMGFGLMLLGKAESH